jgi:hypothetical protein
MLDCPLYTEHKINSGTYIPGVGHGRQALNSDSDNLDDRRLIVVFLGEKAQTCTARLYRAGIKYFGRMPDYCS